MRQIPAAAATAAAAAAAAAVTAATAPAALRGVVEDRDGDDGVGEAASGGGVAGRWGEGGVTDRTIPPLQRRSSGLAAGLTRRFSQRGPNAPADVQEEGEDDGQDEKQEGEEEEEEGRP